MNQITKAALPLLLSLGMISSGAATVLIPLYGGPDDTSWQNITIPGVMPTAFKKSANGALTANAMDAFGMLVRPLTGVRDYPILRWRWRVEKAPPATDATKKGGDDRPIAVHVWFPMAEKERSIWTSIGDTLSSFIGLPPSGRVITYMWGGKHKTGASFTNPHLPDRGMIVIKRSTNAPLFQWMTETIDIAADYRKLFRANGPAPSHIAISADTDDTGVKSRSAIANLRFTARNDQ
jgi:hypothetical protein